jgi:hypothetical protein
VWLDTPRLVYNAGTYLSLSLYTRVLCDNGKWKMLQNEVGLLGQLSSLWLLEA